MQIRLGVPLGASLLTAGENEAVRLQTLSPSPLLGPKLIPAAQAWGTLAPLRLQRWISEGMDSHCLPASGPLDSL